jgi:hypothetical protein
MRSARWQRRTGAALPLGGSAIHLACNGARGGAIATLSSVASGHQISAGDSVVTVALWVRRQRVMTAL